MAMVQVPCMPVLTMQLLMQALPWIVDVGYTVMCVALMLALMGHVLFGDFEATMVTMSDSVSGGHC